MNNRAQHKSHHGMTGNIIPSHHAMSCHAMLRVALAHEEIVKNVHIFYCHNTNLGMVETPKVEMPRYRKTFSMFIGKLAGYVIKPRSFTYFTSNDFDKVCQKWLHTSMWKKSYTVCYLIT